MIWGTTHFDPDEIPQKERMERRVHLAGLVDQISEDAQDLPVHDGAAKCLSSQHAEVVDPPSKVTDAYHGAVGRRQGVARVPVQKGQRDPGSCQ
jgi:hypothetical protein